MTLSGSSTAHAQVTRANTLGALLVARGAASPDALAFADEEREVTFGELAEAAAQLATQLARRGSAGAGPRRARAACRAQLRRGFWALQLLRAVPCAFNPVTLRHTLARRVESIRPRFVLMEKLDAAGRAFTPDPARAARPLASLQRTSGSSGAPRAAMLTHRNVLASCERPRRAATSGPATCSSAGSRLGTTSASYAS